MDKVNCNLNSKTWPVVMGVKNLILGMFIVIGGSIWLSRVKHFNVLNKFIAACGVFVATLNIMSGVLLISAVPQGKNRMNLLYVLLELTVLFTLVLSTGMTNVDYDSVSWTLIVAFILCPICNVGLFYLEQGRYRHQRPLVAAGLNEIEMCSNSSSPISLSRVNSASEV